MTPTERATNVIERIERLFAGATREPWESLNDDQRVSLGKESYTLKYQSVRANGHNIIRFVGSEEGIGNASLIVTLRNVGLEGIVGPIRRLMERPCRVCYQAGCLCAKPLGLYDLHTISEWCDRWEPELDREERWSPQLRTEIRER